MASPKPNLVHQVEQRLVGLADEVVEPLDAQPVEVEMGGHATRLPVGLEDGHLVSGLQQEIRGGEAHRPGADDRYVCHE